MHCSVENFCLSRRSSYNKAEWCIWTEAALPQKYNDTSISTQVVQRTEFSRWCNRFLQFEIYVIINASDGDLGNAAGPHILPWQGVIFMCLGSLSHLRMPCQVIISKAPSFSNSTNRFIGSKCSTKSSDVVSECSYNYNNNPFVSVHLQACKPKSRRPHGFFSTS